MKPFLELNIGEEAGQSRRPGKQLQKVKICRQNRISIHTITTDERQSFSLLSEKTMIYIKISL